MHYKAPDNSVHVIEPEFVYLLPAGCIPITDAEAEALRPVPPPPSTPSCSPRQIRQALTAAGLRSSVEAAVAAGSQDLKDWWEFSTTIERTHPEVAAMGAALGQTPEALDALFTAGAAL